MKMLLKFLLFSLTPHLFFDKIQYLFAVVKSDFAESIRGKNNIFVFLGCDYANLGDYAITLAQKRILEKNYPERNVVVISVEQTYSALKAVVRNNNPEDLITLIGGGNMGEMYYGYERKRNLIISKLHNHKIISFPQTISFSTSALGKLALKRTIRTYSHHHNLTLLAREEKSFDLMRKYFPNNTIALTPDVVMTYKVNQCDKKREGVVMSIRRDKESALSDLQRTKIKVFAKTLGPVSYRDTCPESCDDLDVEFKNLLLKYSESRLVITDRLHGMIFAFIAGTPAIVFDNSNNKILHSYEWIKDCDYIKLVQQDDIDDLNNIIDYAALQKKYSCDNCQLEKKILSSI